MTCSDGKQSFLSTHPDTRHGRLRARPWWIHGSPHERLLTPNTALVWNIKKTATAPWKIKSGCFHPGLFGKGKSSSSPSEIIAQLVGLPGRYLGYSAPRLPLQTCDQVPSTWGVCTANTPAAGATALLGDQGLGQTLYSSPGSDGHPKQTQNQSFPADLLFVVLERTFGYKKTIPKA